jgi:hypothetical protein
MKMVLRQPSVAVNGRLSISWLSPPNRIGGVLTEEVSPPTGIGGVLTVEVSPPNGIGGVLTVEVSPPNGIGGVLTGHAPWPASLSFFLDSRLIRPGY